MKRSFTRIATYLLLLAAVCVATVVACTNDRDPPPAAPSEVALSSRPYVKAAHWFGDGWAVNLWNTDLESGAAADFAAIKEDGFNTIVLVVPWAGFTDAADGAKLVESRVERLLRLIRLAGEMDLKVILRMSYAWDSADETSGHRLTQVWLDAASYQGWLTYFELLWRAVGSEPNVLFAFFSWEDLWAVVSFADAAPEYRKELAVKSGFSAWLQRTQTIDSINQRFQLGWADWADAMIPARREPFFKLYLEFIDDAWLNRFFLPAQSRFPRLSMEIRIDSDPIWDGDRLLEWHGHERAWDLPGSDWTTIYWSPAMGGVNEGETLSPEVAAERLRQSLVRIHENTGARNIFIGQFLAEDFTPGYERNGKIPREQVDEFLAAAAAPLQELAAGYGLWTWTDYFHDAIASPDFSAGPVGWEGVDQIDENSHDAAVDAGDTPSYTIDRHAYHSPGGPAQTDFCMTARVADATSGAITIRDELAGHDLGQLEFEDALTQACLRFPVADVMKIALLAPHGAVIDAVNSRGFLQPSGMRGHDGKLKAIGEAYRELNSRLALAPKLVAPLHDDGWMGKAYLREVAIPPGPNPTLSFRTFIPADWPVRPALKISIDGQVLLETHCDDNQAVNVKLASLVRPGDHTLRIEASPTHSPGSDQRALGCLIKDLQIANDEALP